MTCRIRELEEESLKALNKLRDRIQELEEQNARLLGLCKWAAGRFLDLESVKDSEAIWDALQDKGV